MSRIREQLVRIKPLRAMVRAARDWRSRLTPQPRAWLVRAATQRRRRDDLVRLGSWYGGWTVPASLIGPDSVCYCAGVGEDVTFDLALIERFGCEVWAFDPTPRSRDYAAQIREPRFHFKPWGIWHEDASLDFFPPANPRHISHSAIPEMRPHATEASFTARCRPIPDIMEELRHETLDLLKLDIEGAEHPVLADVGRFSPTVLCVEFDQPKPIRDVLRTIRRLEGFGYEIVAQTHWDFTLVRRDRT